MKKWRELKFPLRIHWGYYSLLALEASWAVQDMSNEKNQGYFELYSKFNPAKFDANEWMSLMKRPCKQAYIFRVERSLDTEEVASSSSISSSAGAGRVNYFRAFWCSRAIVNASQSRRRN